MDVDIVDIADIADDDVVVGCNQVDDDKFLPRYAIDPVISRSKYRTKRT